MHGDGSGNRFVIVPDPEGTSDLTETDVWDLVAPQACDGVLRVTPTESATEPWVAAQARQAMWFMDYRNADGSIAEMCGNGTRVVAEYLRTSGLVQDDEFWLATRSGPVRMTWHGDEWATRIKGWRVLAERVMIASPAVPAESPVLPVDLGNPHVVVALTSAEEVAALDLTAPPALVPAHADGANVEFVHVTAPGELTLRVHERGVGETASCGTGVCAAALAARWWGIHDGERVDEWLVHTPGGDLRVTVPAESVEAGEWVDLTGSATLSD